jgi:hypothetical protein
LFEGYYNDDAATAARIRNEMFHTGDLGFLREGELYVLHRQDGEDRPDHLDSIKACTSQAAPPTSAAVAARATVSAPATAPQSIPAPATALTTAPESELPAGTINRIVYESEKSSIVQFAEGDDGPDLIVFAGPDQQFGRSPLADLPALFAGTLLEGTRKFFVTETRTVWYLDSVDELTGKLDQLSDRPKVLLGIGLGGYAAVRFSSRLRDVRSVIAFVPQIRPNRTEAVKELYPEPGIKPDWWLKLEPGIGYCLLYGEQMDAGAANYLREQITDPKHQRVVIVPGVDHRIVMHLSKRNELGAVLNAALRPDTMGDEVERLVAKERI